jgi:O-methyltransferase involved in polyketide biosynthesis
MFMGVSEKLMNYAALRPYAIMEVIRRHFPASIEHPVILDPTTGYGAEYIWLAEEFPQAEFIEMDRPDTIQNKVNRLKDFRLPKNLKFEGADLASRPLDEVLQGRRIDMMVVLGTYAQAKEFGSLLLYLRSILPAGSLVIVPFPFKPGVIEMANMNAIFRRFAAPPAGAVQNKAEAEDIFHRAGYRDITAYTFAELARDLGKPEPFDIELIAVGRIS